MVEPAVVQAYKTDEMKLVAFLESNGIKMIATETDYSDLKLKNGRTFFKFPISPELTKAVAEFKETLLQGKALMVDVHAFFASYMHARNLALRPRV